MKIFTSPFGTYSLDATNIAHAFRLLGNRVARAERAEEVLLELRSSDLNSIASYLFKADHILSVLAEADRRIENFLDPLTQDAYLEGYNSAITGNGEE